MISLALQASSSWLARASPHLRPSSGLLSRRRVCTGHAPPPPDTDLRSQQLLHSVDTALERHVQLSKGQLLVVSVSGGADSVALLRLLLDLQPRWQLNLHVLHFNHGLRLEAEAEEDFVRALAMAHELPIHVRRLPAGWLEGSPGGMQERSRKWRRSESTALLAELRDDSADEEGAVALAHHRDDQVETVLLKAVRGVHLSRVHGMRWRRSGFVRPLLGVRKQQLLAYLDAAGQPWMEDASNAEPKYQRNRVRLQLVPLLAEMAGGEGALLARMEAAQQQSAEMREWLERAAADHLAQDRVWPRGLSVAALLSQPPPVQDELLRALLTQRAGGAEDDEAVGGGGGGRQPSYSWLRRARAQIAGGAGSGGAGWTLHLDGDLALRRTGDLLQACAAGPATDSRARGGGSGGAGAGAAAPLSWFALHDSREKLDVSIAHPASCRLRASRWADGDAAPPHSGVLLHGVPHGARLLVRSWREGDVHQPEHAEKPLKLSQYLRAQKVELSERRLLPLVLRLAEGDTDADADAAYSGPGVVIAVYPEHVGRGFGTATAEAAEGGPAPLHLVLEEWPMLPSCVGGHE